MHVWGLYAGQIRTLEGRLGFVGGPLEFLAYEVDLDSGHVLDRLKNEYVEDPRTLCYLESLRQGR